MEDASRIDKLMFRLGWVRKARHLALIRTNIELRGAVAEANAAIHSFVASINGNVDVPTHDNIVNMKDRK